MPRIVKAFLLFCIVATGSVFAQNNSSGLSGLPSRSGGSSSSGGAPTDAEYVTYSTNATLTQERVLTAGTDISLDTATPGQIIVNSTATSGLTHDQVMVRASVGF